MAAEWEGLVSSQAKYTPKRSCPVIRRKKGSNLGSLSRCLGIGPLLVRVFHDFPRLLAFWFTSMFVNESRNNALCSSASQEDFRLRQLDFLIGFLVGSLIAEYPNMTSDSR
ncbi:hypothetical protein TNCV_4442561 [Trichonephila clavipes]|nr:hypothetical protein TNCV_4442561 [Trichonephila clavipes]